MLRPNAISWTLLDQTADPAHSPFPLIKPVILPLSSGGHEFEESSDDADPRRDAFTARR
jgi:hypothetical protein